MDFITRLFNDLDNLSAIKDEFRFYNLNNFTRRNLVRILYDNIYDNGWFLWSS